MKVKFWTSERLLSLSALFVSLMTLIVFIYQTNLIRKQQYMSVYPYLEMGNQYTGSLKYEFVIKNNGIGPAIINSLEIESPGGKTYTDFVDYLEDVIPSDSILYSHANFPVGKLIPEKTEISAVSLINDELLKDLGMEHLVEPSKRNDLADAQQLYLILNDEQLKITITYKSIYGELWEINENSEVPIKK